jgi:phospholipid/cholesterol/gamma-HCH transport system substrate-binding protein
MEFGSQNGVPGVIITMNVRTIYRNQITTRSIASIKTVGMLGDKYVDISIGHPDEAPLADAAFIPVKNPKELSDMMEQVDVIVDNITATTNNLRSITDTIQHGHGTVGKLLCDPAFAEEISGIASKLNKITTSLSERKGTLGKLLNDDALYTKLDNTATDLSAISSELHRGKGTAGKLLTNDSLYLSFQSISHRMDTLLGKIDSDSSSIGPFLNSAAGYQQLSAVVQNLNDLLSDIKQNPKKYVHLSLF